MAISSDPKTFDPYQADDESSVTLRYLTAGVLVRMDRGSQRMAPELAERWTVVDEGRRIEFTLRGDARFSDGSPVSAEDVIRSMHKLFDPAEHSAVADEFGSPPERLIASPDHRRVQILFSHPIVNVLRLFDEVAITSALGVSAQSPVSGMYRLKEFRPGEFVLLERNANYWKYQKNPLAPEQVRLCIQSVREVEVAKFLHGDLDLLDGLDPDSFERVRKANPSGARDAGPSLDSDFMWFNQRSSAPLADHKKHWFAAREFRNAVSLAINRADLVRIAYHGYGEPALGPVSPANQLWFNRKLRARVYDPGQALALLRQAGFIYRDQTLFDSGGHRVEFSLMTNAGNRSREMSAALIQQDLKKIGILAGDILERRFSGGAAVDMTLSTSFSVTYANDAGVRDVKLSCASGEVLALIGESGSGKTTIAHALLGLLPGSAKIAGTAIANGVEILRAPARVRRELLRKSIGYIPQDASACFSPYVCLGKQLWRFWTVRTSRNDRARFHDRATTCLRSVHLDPEVMKRYPQQLSLGQIQRAAIANAIMTEPELLIAEEPTSALDAVTGAGVLALLGRAALRGMSVLLVTHDLGAPLRLAHNAAVLRSGIIVERGPVSTITTAPSHPYTRSLLAAAAWNRSPGGHSAKSSNSEEVCLAANENRKRRTGRNGNS